MKKPKIRFDKSMGLWLCGGLSADGDWHIDWFSGNTPLEAYQHWRGSFGKCA
jgi:hypothetical protein